MSENRLTGRCACGSVRYRLTGDPLFVHCCHCYQCQRETGGAFAVNALIESDRVIVEAGAPVPVTTPTESGKGQVIWRCPDCGIALWSNYAGFDELVRFVRAGTLDDTGRLVPDIHIYTASKQPWVALPEDARVVEAYYDLKEQWPEESRERLKVLFAAKS